MMTTDDRLRPRPPADHEDYSAKIAKALATPGGHLSIGRGGWTLCYAGDYGGIARLSWYNPDGIKPLAIAAGLPVIDSRCASIESVARLAISGPMIAVGQQPDPQPWHAFSHAPLIAVARAYAAEGAEVYNLDLDHEQAA